MRSVERHPDQMPRRFRFGRNWRNFLEGLEELQVLEAERSLRDMLKVGDLASKRFLDVGSGSGLFSLAARRMGAVVHSIDLDPDSVACARELKHRFFRNDADWTIEQGSVLDASYLSGLGTFDLVYSWGVLHHTGSMWQAVRNTLPLVAPDGLLFLALYNDQGWRSRIWRAIKWTYNALPSGLRFLVLGPAFVRLWGPTLVRDAFKGNAFQTWTRYRQHRGMSAWVNVVDWVGGYPFEVASAEAVIEFVGGQGFSPLDARLCHPGHGCNEFLFRRRATT